MARFFFGSNWIGLLAGVKSVEPSRQTFPQPVADPGILPGVGADMAIADDHRSGRISDLGRAHRWHLAR